MSSANLQFSGLRFKANKARMILNKVYDAEVLENLLYEAGAVSAIREGSAAIDIRIPEELLRVLDQCLTGSRRRDDRKTAADRLYDGGTGLDDITTT